MLMESMSESFWDISRLAQNVAISITDIFLLLYVTWACPSFILLESSNYFFFVLLDTVEICCRKEL
jgi:hypothetical protein